VTVRRGHPRLFGWPVWASIASHGAVIATASIVVALAPAVPPPDLLPIEVVRLEPAVPPPPPPERPKPPRVKVTPPRLVTQPTELAQPTLLPAPLLTDASPRESVPVAEPSDSSRRFLAGATAPSSWSLPGLPGGHASRSGKLFATGDLPIAAAPGGSGHGGGGGDGTRLEATQAAVKGNPTGLTSFARPVGGYQTRPRYPDSARRQGIEGETLLRFQVLTTGRVTSVSVARSAGHVDLDRAAIDAVKTWRFEPARRGREAVAVWVTLPVRFQLQSGIGE
jgi:protein TonB